MELLIKQNLETVKENMGYEPYDDVDIDDLLFQQGYDAYVEEVEEGEMFKIPEGCLGQIIDEETYYIPFEIMEGIWDKEEIIDDLKEGSYQLEGNLVRLL